MNAMRVILVPGRLRLAALMLFLCVPLAGIETVVATRAPWWRLPYPAIGMWSASAFLMALPLSVWLMRGRGWARGVTEALLVLWLALSAWFALRTRNPGLGFLTVALIAAFGAWVTWIRRELGRSFFDPRMHWFQGLPRPLPGLTCRVALADRELDCQVSRIDREGAFVFSSSPGALRASARSELTFRFRERSVRCVGVPVRALTDGLGAGFQFQGLAPDLRKQLGDFIETLKGEGYVLE